MIKQKRILALDDEPNMRRLLEISLKQANYQPVIAQHGQEALEILRQGGIDLVVSDMHMPVMDGLKLLTAMRNEHLEIPVIIVTAQGEIHTAVEAMKLGAADYILRPFDLSTLEIAIDRALSLSRLKLENRFLRDEVSRATASLVGQSTAMQLVHKAISQVAPEKATTLIAGETGTGKELVAHAIHQLSPRKDALFVAVNCAAIPGDMLESELFGHERGAFTGAIKERIGKFELADGGTLFLDEITEMPIGLQAKLLRALQQGVIERLGSNRSITVDIRVVAATNRDPQQAIADGKLREDLYYRLNVFRIDLPPLRARISDIPQLSHHFLQSRNLSISPAALLALQAYAWPGNVRELENILERAAIMSSGAEISIQHLPADIAGRQPAIDTVDTTPPAAIEAPLTTLPLATEALEKKMITAALLQSSGNKSKAARLLDISERSLWYKLSRYTLEEVSSAQTESP
ncbi:sigma-54 dependent transcriptional regulator [Methylobacillus gramineus]|uniref:sigma-54-dependent transcriptional regulator n=1 Tax=Methylobacillus gramineus TaxID=755169 RepID=UPI001CFF8DD5|nr:sigma-54 dependent transcriptional regulator [Methylobacillus gramineus]MCB5185907.1 sigma-54 dependent transcriptional regulator [Methylobacillus gramineus]